MGKWLRRIRGAIGIGLTWAVGWAPVGALVGWVTGMALGVPLVGVATNYAVLFAVLGFVGGTVMFSTVVRIAEGRRSFDELSMPRFVAWGALGGLGLGALAVALGILGAGFGVLGVAIASVATMLGAGSAAGTLAVARAGDPLRGIESGGGDARERVTHEPGRVLRDGSE